MVAVVRAALRIGAQWPRSCVCILGSLRRALKPAGRLHSFAVARAPFESLGPVVLFATTACGKTAIADFKLL